MGELNEFNNKNESCCKSTPRPKTMDDEIRYQHYRIEELINERNELLTKLKQEETKRIILVDCLANEHHERIVENNQTQYYIKRNDLYRSAINEIAEKCHNILREDAKEISKSVEQLAKEIWEITYRF